MSGDKKALTVEEAMRRTARDLDDGLWPSSAIANIAELVGIEKRGTHSELLIGICNKLAEENRETAGCGTKLEIKEAHLELMEHCIGLGRRKPYRRHGRLYFKPNRNHFDCGPADEPEWRDMATAGYAVDSNGRGWYKLTKKGFAKLSEATGIHIYDDEAYVR